jgi:starch-binding outer membrane protein, SusD/RagB family
MNKKNLYILACGILSMSVASCSLDVEPQTSILDASYYKTAAEAETALVGCYDGLQRTTSDGNLSFYVTSEVLADECFGGTGYTDGRGYQAIDRFDQSQSSSDNDLFNGTWTDYYAGIFRCNNLLQKIDNIDWTGNETEYNSIVGQTKFLRAYMYFDLVRLFGNIPLVTVPTTDNVAQDSAVTVYRQIAKDLVDASSKITYPSWSTTWAASNDGRATQWAAKALLARVYLFYTGYYGKSDLAGVVTKSQALAAVEDVIKNGGYSLITSSATVKDKDGTSHTITPFARLWPASSVVSATDSTLNWDGYAGRGNSETVFAQKFNYTQDYNGNEDGNAWLVMMGIRNTSMFPYGRGWGCCTVNPEFVSDFNSSDQRKTASIIDFSETTLSGSTLAATFKAAASGLSDQREYTGYAVKKYTPLSLPNGDDEVTGKGTGSFQISQYQDFIAIRYADVLLMAAELGSSNALTYLNEVRERAGLSDAFSTSEENILNERKCEFAFEGIRYWDLLRQGISTAAKTISTSGISVLSGGNSDEVIINSSNIINTSGLMQIPNTQITLSDGVLKQNTGWN